MANIALTTASRVEVVGAPEIQHTAIAAEAITPGAGVRFDAAGKFTNGNGTTTTEADLYGVATGTGITPAGMPLTAVRKGLLDGFNLTSQAYGAKIYASDTDGRLADAAGTVSEIVGSVVPANSQTLGNSPDKLLFVDL